MNEALCGRERELEQLAGGVESARAGKGGAWLIGGEPGIGKSRLLEELANRASRAEVDVLWGRAWEAGGAPAYWPWLEVLRALLQRWCAALLLRRARGWRRCSRCCPS